MTTLSVRPRPFSFTFPHKIDNPLTFHHRKKAVFSKSYCPYCRASKTLLSEMGAKFYVIEMDQVGESFFFFF